MQPILYVVGRYYDKDYQILDLNHKTTMKCKAETLMHLTKEGLVANAEVIGREIKGVYMSFSRLSCVEDVGEDEVGVVLCSKTLNGVFGYLVCNQAGGRLGWRPCESVRANADLYCNVSEYWTRKERKKAVASKGFEFPDYDKLYSQRKQPDTSNSTQRVNHIVTQQTTPPETSFYYNFDSIRQQKREAMMAEMLNRDSYVPQHAK